MYPFQDAMLTTLPYSNQGAVNPFAPTPAWGGGVPQSFYESRGLNDAGLVANNYAWNQAFNAPWGDVRQASRNLGFEGAFGQGRLSDWMDAGSPAEDRALRQALQAEIPEVRARRMAYAEQAYPGINPNMWEGYVQPGQMHPEYDVPFGIARGAMRNLGFEGQFGGGRGGAFQQQIGKDAVRAEIERMTAQQPYEQRAYTPTFSTWFNPYNFLNAGAQPFFGSPWYYDALLGENAGAGAGRFLQQNEPELGQLTDEMKAPMNREFIEAPQGHHSPLIRNPLFIGYRYGTEGFGTRGRPMQYQL